MIAITTNSRRMTTETEQRRRVRAMEIVKSLHPVMDLITKAGPAQVNPESRWLKNWRSNPGRNVVALGALGDYGRRR